MLVGSSTLPNLVWACREGVPFCRTWCGHAGREFHSAELGVGMQGGSSTLLNLAWTWCGHAGREFHSAELDVGMQGGGSVLLNLVWACREGVPLKTGCGHAGREFH